MRAWSSLGHLVRPQRLRGGAVQRRAVQRRAVQQRRVQQTQLKTNLTRLEKTQIQRKNDKQSHCEKAVLDAWHAKVAEDSCAEAGLSGVPLVDVAASHLSWCGMGVHKAGRTFCGVNDTNLRKQVCNDNSGGNPSFVLELRIMQAFCVLFHVRVR